MIPAALYLANYASSPVDVMPAPPKATGYSSNVAPSSNVVAVDFKRKIVREQTNEQECPAWQKVATTRLNRLRDYQAGWDGPASLPIASDSLARAGRLLELAFEGISYPAPPSAVPCADGSLQLEWWLTDTRFELSIDADGSVSAWAENRRSGDEIEAEGKDAANLLFQWARRLTADKLAQHG